MADDNRGLRMTVHGDRIIITIGDSPSKMRDFRRDFHDYAPLLDHRRGEPSLDDLKKRVIFALGLEQTDLAFVLHVEAVDGMPIKREVRCYPKDGRGGVLAIARWSREDGLSVHSIN